MNKNRKILITGSTGFLGRHTVPILRERYGIENVICVSSRDYDLMNPLQVNKMFENIKPHVVVHLAAYSGGIGANRAFPADFYFRNTILTALTFDACSRYKVEKIVYPMGGCSYPAKAKSPIDESQLFCGYPQEESAGYSTAKMMGIVAAKSYKSQYGLNATVIIPGNMYGEFDNFNPRDSHVIAAMIRRYFEAKLGGDDEVIMWGTGSPERDFVYAGDVAATIPFFIENYNEVGPVNISSGTRISVKELAETIAKLTGFTGKINWDISKPDGQMIKVFSVEELHSLGLSCRTSLIDGLKKTISWFQENYKSKGDNIRL